MQILIIQFHSNNSFVSTNSVSAPKSSSSVETEDFSSYAHGTTGLQISPFINEYHGYGSGWYCDQLVKDGPYGSHTKVLYVRDAQGGRNTWSVHYLDNPLSQGIIEFSLYLNPGSSSTSPNYHFLKFQTFDDTIAFEFRFNLKNGDVQYSDGLAWSGNILDLDIYKWYRYEIGFDVSIGTYDLTCTEEVSGIQQEFIEDISYKNSVSIEEMYIGTDVADYSGNSRWDDFRFEENLDPINIITPESRSYRPHIEGRYYGTFSFEMEEEGSSGTDIDYVDSATISSNCEVQISNEFQGHKKVLKIRDGNDQGNAGAKNYFDSTQESGVIEWWWSTSRSGSNFIMYHLHEDIMSTHAGGLGMSDGNFKDMEGNIVQSYTTYQWYHHKLTFNTDSDTYNWYIDGILRVENGNFVNDVTNIGSTHIKGGWNSKGSCYIDAIGYSWDSNYDSGDNNPVRGYYPGTFGFEDQIDGTSGTDVRFVETNTYPTCEIISDMDGHNKVLKLTSDANWRSIYDLINDQSEGTIEWWVRTPISYYGHRLILYDGATHAINLYFQNDGNIYARGGSQIYLTTYSANTWTHVRIDFDCGSDTFSVYINGEKFGPFAFKNGVSAIDKIFFDTGGAGNTRYMDAVGYSWDDYYTIGDNRDEGLFLDFTPDDMNNMEYTLDNGQTLIPIYGDTAIPIPETGDYTLIVSGDGYASSSVSFKTKISKGFLYAQSSESQILNDEGTWIDEDTAINSIETPGDYLVIYTATYEIYEETSYGFPCVGEGWVQLLVDDTAIGRTKRKWDCLNTKVIPTAYGAPTILGTLIVADMVTINSGGVKAEIYYDVWEEMEILDRSICAIPLKEGYVHDYSETSFSWDEHQKEDNDPHIETDALTGEYLAIYTASFELSDWHPIGVHSDIWAAFSISDTALTYTTRHWEMPGSYGESKMSGTIVIADRIVLENQPLGIRLRLNQRPNLLCFPMLTVGKRSLILIPLTQEDYFYESRHGDPEDFNNDIIFEDISSKCFVMYTATNFIEGADPKGWGWTAFNDGISTIEHTTRCFEFPSGYGNGMWTTIYNIEILDLYKDDIKVEYYWEPENYETYGLHRRSMILIPFF